MWIDFRAIKDEYMRGRGIDYFANSRRATLVQRLFEIENLAGYAAYGRDCWGINASDCLEPAKARVAGVDS
jgi:hypothetical protein